MEEIEMELIMGYLKIFDDMQDVLCGLPKELAGELIQIMIEYNRTGAVLDGISSALAIAWPMIKNTIDACKAAEEKQNAKARKAAASRWRKEQDDAQDAQSGPDGCEDMQGDAKACKAMHGDACGCMEMHNDADQDQDQDQEHDLQQEQQIDARAREDEPAMGEAGKYAWQNLRGMNRANLRELRRFTLPEEVIRYAVDEACAAGAANWAYCRSILERYQREGIDTAGKAKADHNRRSVPIRGSGGVTAQDYHQRSYTEEQLRSPAADRLLREAEAMSEGRLVVL